jgi:hypothetical protein
MSARRPIMVCPEVFSTCPRWAHVIQERRLWVMNRLRGKELTPNGTALREIGSPGASAAGGRTVYHINGTVMG